MARKPADQTVQPDAIVQAAASVFQRQGYHGATMAEIAAEVGLTAGSLYHHFPSKQDLLIAVLQTGLAQITAEVRAIVQSGDPPAEKLRRIVHAHIRSEIDHANIAAAVIFESRALLVVPQVRDQFVAQRDALEALYRRVIDEGIASGAFRPADAGIFVKTLFGALNWVHVWYRPGGPFDRGRNRRRDRAVVSGGAASRRGPMSESPAVPDFLAHYYEAARGPFRSLSTLAHDDAERLLDGIRASGATFASRRASDYLAIRRELETRIRMLFVARGGQPQRDTPHYLILGACPWVKTWYADGREVRVPLADCDPAVVSLTYGDSFPAMRFQDGKPTRGQVYTLADLPDLVARYGLPQVWNAEGERGPDRYIEAQLWSDEPLRSMGLLG